MIRGRDVSHYQKDVDWAGLAADEHLSFGAAKCSEGISFADSYYRQNHSRVRAAGLRFIAYHYATPGSSPTIAANARAQAARFIALADPQPGDALCLDLEKSSLTQAQTNAWMREFGDALHDLAPGFLTIAYLGGYAANGSGQQAVDHFDRWWYPRSAGSGSWPTTFAPRVDLNTTGWKAPPAPHIWQFTPNSKGMDANVSNLTIDELFNTGDNMPTAADIWDAPITVTGLDGKPVTFQAGDWLAFANLKAGQARDSSAAALAILNGTNPAGLDAFAAALAAKFPEGSGPTAQQIAAAVRAEFATALGGTS